MWSGWPERVDVYLGGGTVLVKRRAHSLVNLQPLATLPLGDVLAQVDQACDRAGGRPWRLHVALGAALCPPVRFIVPNGVKRWSESMALARAACAATWGLRPDEAGELVCTMDTGSFGLAAALMKGARDRIVEWSGLHGGHLASLQPLWAIATQSPACRARHIHQLTLHEPGAVAVVREALAAEAAAPSPEEGIRLRFSPEVLPPGRQCPLGPVAWAGHWERLP